MISEEEMEEYRMLSNFSVSEVRRIFKVFFEATAGAELMHLNQFLRLDGIRLNPLKHRIARCFGFEDAMLTSFRTEESGDDEADEAAEVEAGNSATAEHGKGISFADFLVALSVFNGAGRRGQKLRMAFLIQDFDDDGIVSRTDLLDYFKCTVEGDLQLDEMEFLVDEIIAEASSLPQLTGLTFSDFQRVVGPTDFETRLRLPI